MDISWFNKLLCSINNIGFQTMFLKSTNAKGLYFYIFTPVLYLFSTHIGHHLNSGLVYNVIAPFYQMAQHTKLPTITPRFCYFYCHASRFVFEYPCSDSFPRCHANWDIEDEHHNTSMFSLHLEFLFSFLTVITLQRNCIQLSLEGDNSLM